MNSSHCLNCGASKTMEYYTENYCASCMEAIKEAREYAVREKVDIGTATKSALAQRAHDTHRNRPDPRFPMGKADYWNAEGLRREEMEQKTGEEGIVVLVVCIVILLLAPVFMAMPLG